MEGRAGLLGNIVSWFALDVVLLHPASHLLQNSRVPKIEHCSPDIVPATLGDVLYAGVPGPLIAEQGWVDLVHEVAARDAMALQALYARAHRAVFTLAMRITANRESAEEVTVDVFHDVWRGAPSYDAADGTVLAWIMNLARARSLESLRSEQRKRAGAEGSTKAAPEPASTCEALDRKRQVERLARALSALAPSEREAIEIAFFSELSYAQVAERLDRPVGTIKTRIRTGLQKLRDALEAQSRPS
jgi:RNA polymerase sigma-70 factor (ECF subfamily)